MAFKFTLFTINKVCYGLNKTKINLTQLAIIQTFWKAGPLFAVFTKSLESDYKGGRNQIRPFKCNWWVFASTQTISVYLINLKIGDKRYFSVYAL